MTADLRARGAAVKAPQRKRWCGRAECRRDTRMVESGDDLTPRRCRLCHPHHVGMADSMTATEATGRPRPHTAPTSRRPSQPSRRPSQVHRDAQQRDPRWWADAWAVIDILAREDRPFTTADLRQGRFGLGEPTTPSAWGAIISAARAAGLIRKVGYQPSSVGSRHGGAVVTWVGTGDT